MAVLEEERKSKVECAEESPKTLRAREKLKKQLGAVEEKITPEALKKTRLEIHRWIARHAHHRVVLRNKNISLFDNNQNAAGLSNRVAGLAKKIQDERSDQPQSLRKIKSIVQEKSE